MFVHRQWLFEALFIICLLTAGWQHGRSRLPGVMFLTRFSLGLTLAEEFVIVGSIVFPELSQARRGRKPMSRNPGHRSMQGAQKVSTAPVPTESHGSARRHPCRRCRSEASSRSLQGYGPTKLHGSAKKTPVQTESEAPRKCPGPSRRPSCTVAPNGPV